MLSQLFGTDAEDVPLGSVMDALIAQQEVGTVVKVDDDTSDPYALISILDLSAACDVCDHCITDYDYMKFI